MLHKGEEWDLHIEVTSTSVVCVVGSFSYLFGYG